ncbi:hypothetical protein A2U01_0067767, partial [Trifolium medium]|nr:hypothetical protein [Trifolium medium]
NFGSAWKTKGKPLTSRMNFAWCEIGAKKSSMQCTGITHGA